MAVSCIIWDNPTVKTRLSKLKMLGANPDFLGANRVFAWRIASGRRGGLVGSPGVCGGIVWHLNLKIVHFGCSSIPFWGGRWEGGLGGNPREILKKWNLTLAMSPICSSNKTFLICRHDFFLRVNWFLLLLVKTRQTTVRWQTTDRKRCSPAAR